jgi:hypothetical protein
MAVRCLLPSLLVCKKQFGENELRKKRRKSRRRRRSR